MCVFGSSSLCCRLNQYLDFNKFICDVQSQLPGDHLPLPVTTPFSGLDSFLDLSTLNYLTRHSPLCWENFLLRVLPMGHASWKLESCQRPWSTLNVPRISLRLKLIPVHDTVLGTSVSSLPTCGLSAHLPSRATCFMVTNKSSFLSIPWMS